MARQLPVFRLTLVSFHWVFREHVDHSRSVRRQDGTAATRAFIAEHERTVRPLERAAAPGLVERQRFRPR